MHVCVGETQAGQLPVSFSCWPDVLLKDDFTHRKKHGKGKTGEWMDPGKTWILAKTWLFCSL